MSRLVLIAALALCAGALRAAASDPDPAADLARTSSCLVAAQAVSAPSCAVPPACEAVAAEAGTPTSLPAAPEATPASAYVRPVAAFASADERETLTMLLANRFLSKPWAVFRRLERARLLGETSEEARLSEMLDMAVIEALEAEGERSQ